jgi:hypothetical protein
MKKALEDFEQMLRFIESTNMTNKRDELRIFKSGSLSKKTEFRIIVDGRIGKREIERLIKNLEMEREVLA